jgi:hypothetical protein
MNKQPIKVLSVDRNLKPKEQPIDLFERYNIKGYNVMIFPIKKSERTVEVVFFDEENIPVMEELFSIKIPSSEDNFFYEFEINDIDEQGFYDVLDKKFEISTYKLTDIEKPVEVEK